MHLDGIQVIHNTAVLGQSNFCMSQSDKTNALLFNNTEKVIWHWPCVTSALCTHTEVGGRIQHQPAWLLEELFHTSNTISLVVRMWSGKAS